MTILSTRAARRLRILLASAAFAGLPLAAYAQDHAGHAGHAGHDAPAAEPADPHAGHDMSAEPAGPHAGHDMSAKPADPHAGHDMSAEQADPHAGHAMSMTGLLGDYPAGRDASGTSWRPDVSQHHGVHGQWGEWMLMGHAQLNLVYDWQDGPRGDEELFVAGMVMGTARRDFSGGRSLTLRAMASPDPFMGKDGYPSLLAAGETADGIEHLVDRQHPHDLFMELSATFSQQLDARNSLFLYAGLPGEPAFGPPAFMHRDSGLDSPLAPISHHWLDSTHITFGVVTAGWIHDRWKVEASSFRGREPDEDRFDIEAPDLDSWSGRLSWNPIDTVSLQVSYADIASPEQLEPDEDERRWSASAIYTRPVNEDGWWSTTLAWGRKIDDHDDHADAWLLESAFKPARDPWTLFARAERVESNELEGLGHGAPLRTVSKVSLGAIHDWKVGENVRLGVGGLYSWNFVPSALEPSYGGDPGGAMVFVRLKVE